MGLAIALFVIYVGFKLMSKNMRTLNSILIIAFIAYMLYMKFGANGEIGFYELKNFTTFISLGIGLFSLGLILGLLRFFSSDEASYENRKGKLFKFLIKWGAIYICFTLIFRLFLVVVLDLEWDATWLFAKFYGTNAFLVSLFIYYFWFRTKTSSINEQ
ncbi:hypothetical protein H5154_03300 [Pseudoalteromonas sp. SR44-5]|uniref:hypothetical protein n=1 Tax=Pseudoalteromonas sp. SR44-5 TaxID=2760934 RepID=UPI001600A633|nr:hypothetical protein [Pseudoalteromonas sp. SR44-5]MBB1365414.1 hypothetical protein [Pseudoalteromonas sp. SR44-5]